MNSGKKCKRKSGLCASPYSRSLQAHIPNMIFILIKITEKIDSVTGFRRGIFQRHTTNMIFVRATVEHCCTVDPRYLDFGYLE